MISDFFVAVDDHEEKLEVSNSHIECHFSSFNSVLLFGSCKSFITKGLDGSVTLYYIALEYAVDAALELSFTAADGKKMLLEK